MLKTTALEERDDLAVEEGHFEIHVGSDVVDDGSYVVVHRRMDDGGWRFALDIWNSDRRPSRGVAPEAAEAARRGVTSTRT